MKEKDQPTYTPEQIAVILKAAKELIESVNLKEIDRFVLSYAWKKAEENEPADLTPFKLRAYIQAFYDDVVGV